MIKVINEPKILTKHALCECKYKFGGRKYNSNQKWNNDKCKKKKKNITYVKNIIFGIFPHVVTKMVNIQQALLTIY